LNHDLDIIKTVTEYKVVDYLDNAHDCLGTRSLWTVWTT